MTQFLGDINSAFVREGFRLKMPRNNIYRIKNSDSLSTKLAEKIISSMQYCPIVSQKFSCRRVLYSIE